MDILSYLLGKNASGGGGGSADLDWTVIGYNSRPKSIDEGYNYAKQIQNNWDTNRTSMDSLYSNDFEMVFYPLVDTNKITTSKNAFANNYGLMYIPLLDTSNIARTDSMFSYCYSLKEIPQFNLSNVVNCQKMFEYCKGLKKVPVFNLSTTTNISGMFTQCGNLTNESLNNIMASCISATNVAASNRTLAKIGLSQAQATTCQSLSNYTAFTNAGWTTGY